MAILRIKWTIFRFLGRFVNIAENGIHNLYKTANAEALAVCCVISLRITTDAGSEPARRGLRTGRATGRIKAGAGLAGNESFGHRPLYRLFCPSLHRATVLITVQVTAALDIPALILRKPEEHCRQLYARHIFVRTEAAILEACNDPHLGSPADHAGIPLPSAPSVNCRPP